ncbi:MAG: DUF979 domain-containing protein [Clostridium sp.]|uniref:DUF979 domain-containing protein n=1 Tax=Clostridium sp. TaxID=1506 RepID=UPI003070FEDC
MSFFMNAEIGLSDKLLEVLFIVMGLVALYVGVKTLLDKEHKSKIGTATFWIALAIVIGFGRWIPNKVNGLLIVVMAIPSVFNKVLPGENKVATPEHRNKMAKKIGNKIFIPALMMGAFAIIFALFTDISPLVGVGVGVFVAMIMVVVMAKETKPVDFLDDAKRMLDMVGPLSILPLLLASLGAIFTASGVGEVVSSLVGWMIPDGNIVIGVIVYAVGMALFTMIMGNAYAAITVMTVGIGAPFVLAHGLDPNIVGMLALTCGFCGTLCTPMAANFNIVPVAILEMKDKYTVIKNQLLVAGAMLAFQIVYILLIA